jgi:glycosyltransferase involved in cell wall biosynthesis
MNDPTPESLRILIACSGRKWIGEAAHCFQLYEKLAETGHRPCLLVREGHELESRARDAEMDVVAMRYSSRFSLVGDWRDIRTMMRLIGGADLVHCHRGKDTWIAALALATMKSEVPLIRTRHVTVPVAPSVFNRWLYGRATARIIAVSSAARDSFRTIGRRWFDRSLADRTRIVYSGVDTTRFSPDRRSESWRKSVDIEEGDILIGLIGRFQRVKGQWEFLRTSGIIARDFPRVRFLMSGRGSEDKRRRYRHMSEALGIDERLILLGEVDDIAAVIASLDIGVVASVGSEASSRIVLEYMATGRPIVATRVGGIPDLIEDGVTGRLVPPGDVALLRDAIVELLKSPRLRRSLAEAARTRAEEYFNLDRWVAETVAVYREALGEGSQKSEVRSGKREAGGE